MDHTKLSANLSDQNITLSGTNALLSLKATSNIQNKAGKASRFTGVFRAGKKWKSQVQANGVQHYLGIFESEEEASHAYQNYKKCNLGVSSRSSIHTNGQRKRQQQKACTIINTPNAMPVDPELNSEQKIKPTSTGRDPSLLQYLVAGDEPGSYVLRIEENQLDDMYMKLRIGSYLNSI